MQCEHHYPGWILRAPPNPRPCSEQPMIQRQLTSEALNSAQMLEVCVLWHGGGGGAHSKGETLLSAFYPREERDAP